MSYRWSVLSHSEVIREIRGLSPQAATALFPNGESSGVDLSWRDYRKEIEVVARKHLDVLIVVERIDERGRKEEFSFLGGKEI